MTNKDMRRVWAAVAMTTLGGVALATEPPREAPQSTALASDIPNLGTTPTLFVVGYAHLDTQWRWTYVDTIREFLPSTLHDNFALFEKYPDYVFNFSGSRRYRMMEEYYPESFARLHEYVAAGRWFPCGSSVDENDANVPSAESLIRHVLYGNNYFRREFGVASEEYMLPDCFGFPAALPSVLAHCGIKGFSTQKLTWGGVVPIPFKVGTWLGPDGRGVIAALDPGAYVGEVKENLAKSTGWLTRINTSAKTSGFFGDYHYFGTGDQGGAPREPSVRMVEESVTTQGPIKVISGPADWLFRSVTSEQRAKLPTYQGELMLTEHSAGSISSQAYMKRWNRKNEILADAAERASVAAWWMGGRSYPSAKLEDAWSLVLGSQMHDILPGTSTPKAYEYSWNDEVLAANQFSSIITDASDAVISALDTLGEGQAVVVYNPLSFAREDVVEASVPTVRDSTSVRVFDPNGHTVPAQILEMNDTSTRVAFVATMEPVSYGVFTIQLGNDSTPVASSLVVTDHTLENEHLRVTINEHGDISSIVDNASNREVLSGPATLSTHYENPKAWPAWNQDWTDRQKPPMSVASDPKSIRVVERGPARVAIEVVREIEGSTVTQVISLAAGDAGRRVEVDATIDWRGKERSLRAAFPLTASNPSATFDIQTGIVERPNSHAKQYEYSFHRWIDLTDVSGDHGASVLCDSKYASDKPDDHTVRLTLLYTPGTQGGYPDQGTQDIGRHQVKYALYPHEQDWRAARSYQHGDRLNIPPITFVASPHEGPLGRSFGLVRCDDPSVTISAIKKAEASDEIIVRLREQRGASASGVSVSFARPIMSAREVDGQEREIGPATVTNGTLRADLGGFELRAYAIRLANAPTVISPVVSWPIPVPCDVDVVSTNANRGDGSMDATHGAYPAEQFPSSITDAGVTYAFRPTTDGSMNAVACHGQSIELPSRDADRVYILAAANEDVRSTVRVGDVDHAWNVPSWTGYIGQWDNREWPGDTDDPAYRWSEAPIGLVPGFIKKDADVAWFASHRHTASGDAFYQYSYVHRASFEVPKGATRVTLPDDPRIKVFAMSLAKHGASSVALAHPLFDTLDGHAQDAPVIVGDRHATDTMSVSIEPGLYWSPGSIRYTTDGTTPKATSPVFDSPLEIDSPLSLSAAVFDTSGQAGPVARATFDVHDTTPPSVKRVLSSYQSPVVTVVFSERVGTVTERQFSIEPQIDVMSVEHSPDRRAIRLVLASPPAENTRYTLMIRDVPDASTNANRLATASATIEVAGPVFTLDEITTKDQGRVVSNIPGLPVGAKDPWTINAFVRMTAQPDNRTVIVGFGRCADEIDGGARYLAKFAGGVHFWSRLRDVPTRTPFTLDTWQMITATYDGELLRVYRDATLVGERRLTLSDDENTIELLPKDPWEEVRVFKGDIQRFTIWNTALSVESLQSLMTGMPGT